MMNKDSIVKKGLKKSMKARKLVIKWLVKNENPIKHMNRHARVPVSHVVSDVDDSVVTVTVVAAVVAAVVASMSVT